ncbi:Zn-ribbon domain-containing OB-fold protein [Natronomonas sp.]|uniref:Zn-ribbon domain-containing OB-fold protein n=1 Tax=Natronomonas sp. TaxID=2184060 RepID=UPI002602D30E|nr:OB-fold domain-containing protein [Natronomonas sp.]
MSESDPAVDRFLEGSDAGLTHTAWKRALREDVLLGEACADCGHRSGAPRAACVRCGSRELEPIALPTSGEVITETTIAVPPEGFDGPHTVAIVELDAARIMAGVEESVDIGDSVELVGVLERDDEPGPLFG